jgi:peptidoglycan/xylan/chitin deacetylase (PgdA/CDA1 family)
MTKGDIAAGVLEATGLAALLRRFGRWEGVLVLNYHRIGDGSHLISDRGIWSATAEEFDAEMDFLTRHCTVVTGEDLRKGIATRAGRYVMVTFDDGYRETHDVVLPILETYGVQATFFPVTGFIDAAYTAWWDEIAWMVNRSRPDELSADNWLPRRVSLAEADRREAAHVLIQLRKALPADQAEMFLDHLGDVTGSGRRQPADAQTDWISWDMARHLHDEGMGFGGHTVTHPILTRLSQSEQCSEITTCLDRLEQELGQRPKLFSYPEGLRGCFDQDTADCLRRNGVELAFSNYGGVARGSTWNPYDVPRTVIASVAISQRRFRATATLPAVFIRTERQRFLRAG